MLPIPDAEVCQGTVWLPQHQLSNTVIPVPQDVNKEPGAEELFKKIGEAYEVSSRDPLAYGLTGRDCSLTFLRNRPFDCGLNGCHTRSSRAYFLPIAVALILQAVCKRITVNGCG